MPSPTDATSNRYRTAPGFRRAAAPPYDAPAIELAIECWSIHGGAPIPAELLRWTCSMVIGDAWRERVLRAVDRMAAEVAS